MERTKLDLSNTCSKVIGSCLVLFLLQKVLIFKAFSGYLSLLVGLLLCYGLALSIIEGKKITVKLGVFITVIIGLLLVHSIWCFVIGNPESLFLTMKVIIFTLLIILTTNSSNKRLTLDYILKILIIFSIASSLYGIILLVMGNASFLQGHRVLSFMGLNQLADGSFPFYRISGLFDNANSAGIISLFGIISLGTSHKKLIPLILLNFIFILLTGSRTALILTILYLLMSNFDKLFKVRALLIYLLASSLLFLLAIYLDSKGVDIFKYAQGRVDDGLSSRDVAWNYLFEWIVTNPLGIGLGHADYLLLEEVKLGFGSHSGHLALLSEIGIIAYTLLIFYLVVITINNFVTVRPSEINHPLIIYLPIIMFIHQFIERGVFQITYHHFLLIIILALPIIRDRSL